jgi:CDP-diacylglycerol--glycerol-3-phosphate 3-phosphatidyltransferase
MSAGYWALQPVARACVALGIGANAVTMTSLVFAAATGAALAFGHFGLAAVLTAVSSLADAVDGLVARESGTASDAGEVFDAAVDRYAEIFFFAGLAFFYRSDAAVLGLVLAALAGSFMVSYATAKAEALRVEAPRGMMRRPERAFYLGLGATLTPLVGRDEPMAMALAAVALIANASAVRRLVVLADRVRKVAQATRARQPSSEPAE